MSAISAHEIQVNVVRRPFDLETSAGADFATATTKLVDYLEWSTKSGSKPNLPL